MPSEKQSVLLTRPKACKILGISQQEFHTLVESGKLHPLKTRRGHYRIPLAEVVSLKAELSHKVLSLPYEAFIQSSAFFCQTPADVNAHLLKFGYPKASEDYIDRHHKYARADSNLDIIRTDRITDFFNQVGPRSREILTKDDLKLLVELMIMISKNDQEIQGIVRSKFGKEYPLETLANFRKYFYNWSIMDPESSKYYFEFLTGREKVLRESAYQRSDYFIYYALNIDFGGDVSELLERSCLGLLYKLNFLIDGYVYGDVAVSQRQLQGMAVMINTLLTASKASRDGKPLKVEELQHQAIAEKILPRAITREEFFKSQREKEFDFGKPGS